MTIKATKGMMRAAMNAGDMPDESNAWAAVHAVLDEIEETAPEPLMGYRQEGRPDAFVYVHLPCKQMEQFWPEDLPDMGCDACEGAPDGQWRQVYVMPS